jgi:hypothetical protein
MILFVWPREYGIAVEPYHSAKLSLDFLNWNSHDAHRSWEANVTLVSQSLSSFVQYGSSACGLYFSCENGDSDLPIIQVMP